MLCTKWCVKCGSMISRFSGPLASCLLTRYGCGATLILGGLLDANDLVLMAFREYNIFPLCIEPLMGYKTTHLYDVVKTPYQLPTARCC